MASQQKEIISFAITEEHGGGHGPTAGEKKGGGGEDLVEKAQS